MNKQNPINDISQKVFDLKLSQQNLTESSASYENFYQSISGKIKQMKSSEVETLIKSLNNDITEFIQGKEGLIKNIEDESKSLSEYIKGFINFCNKASDFSNEGKNKISVVEQLIHRAEENKNDTSSIQRLADAVNHLDCLFDNIREMFSLKANLNNQIDIVAVKEGILQDKVIILDSNKEKVEKKEADLIKLKSKKEKLFIEKEKINSLLNNTNAKIIELKSQLDHLSSYINIESSLKINLSKDNELRLLIASLKASIKTKELLKFEVADLESEYSEMIKSFSSKYQGKGVDFKDQPLLNQQQYLNYDSQQSQKQYEIKSRQSITSFADYNFVSAVQNQNNQNNQVIDYFSALAGCVFYYLLIALKLCKKERKSKMDKELFEMQNKIIMLNERREALQKRINEKEILKNSIEEENIFNKRLKEKLQKRIKVIK